MSIHYKQALAEPVVSNLLVDKGFAVARSADPKTGYQITASKDEVTVRVRVRHLQFDESYNDSPLPYQVYKIKAFPNAKYDPITLQDVDFVIGHNPNDQSFACVPVEVFEKEHQGQASFHPREGLRHEYFNSWDALDEFMKAALLPS